ncbi:MAG: copper-binding protein [Gammaproteobacteria bacterium]|nr:copper-binding protein [Gammaproteobacteria bacterium]MDH3536354.1 copper-binding protein [Gammaproteobacteria bacterium]
MKPQLSLVVFSALLMNASLASADVTDGTVLALDRKAKSLVLTDRSAWALDAMKSAMPEGLKAGDRVEINYESDEDGVSAINGIRILPPKKASSSAPDVTVGTILVFDRKANLIVLTDRTVWALEAMKSKVPGGLKAGDRIEIEYESDEDGVSAINGISKIAN